MNKAPPNLPPTGGEGLGVAKLKKRNNDETSMVKIITQENDYIFYASSTGIEAQSLC